MTILISGSSGFIGSKIKTDLEHQGHKVLSLSRKPSQTVSQVYWSIEEKTIEKDKLEGVDAVIHLSGESVVGKWTEAKKEKIRSSRVLGTKLLVDAILSLNSKPKQVLLASATGFYGDRGDEILNEDSPPAGDFLANVCVEWEKASEPLASAGIRRIPMRIGIVLDLKGGALKSMLPPFKMGVGGRLGSGKQYMSWITLDEISLITSYILNNNDIDGPVNLVSPNPITNSVFTKALGKAIHRPTLFPIPKFAVKAMFGEMGEALLLSSNRIMPDKLMAKGYKFSSAAIHDAFVKIFHG